MKKKGKKGEGVKGTGSPCGGPGGEAPGGGKLKASGSKWKSPG